MGFGTLLSKLPAFTFGVISWVDAFFVSVSAASVTVSSVEFSDTFTKFGMMLLGRIGPVILILAVLAQQN